MAGKAKNTHHLPGGGGEGGRGGLVSGVRDMVHLRRS